MSSLHQAFVAVIVLALSASSAWAQPRPLAVDDVIGLEAIGRAAISPSGQWAVYERQAAYGTAPRFDFGNRSGWAVTTLWLVDLSRPEAAASQLLPDTGPGLLRPTWSPAGSRLALWRFQDGELEVGVMSMSDRSVRWTGLTPEIPLTGADIAWLSEDELIVMTRPDRSLPGILRYYGGSQLRLVEAWDRSRAGREPSRTVLNTRGGVATPETPEPASALVRIDVRSGQAEILVKGRLRDFAVSPDCLRIAIVSANEPVPVDQAALLQAQSAFRQRLTLLDIEGRASNRMIDAVDIAPHLLRWSPDSTEVLVWAREDEARWEEGGLYRVGFGGASKLPAPGLSAGEGAQILRGVRADWSGSTPVLRAQQSSGGRWDWWGLDDGEPKVLTAEMSSPPSQVAGTHAGGLLFVADGALWSATMSNTRRLTSDLSLRAWIDPDAHKVMRLKANDASRMPWVTALDEFGRAVIVWPDGRVRSFNAGGSDSQRVVAAAPEGALALVRSGLSETLQLHTVNTTTIVGEVNSQLSDVTLTQPAAVPHLDVFGRPVTSWLFLPEGGADAARGVIVEVYPGAVDDGGWYGPARLAYGFRAAVAAGAGYAVLTPAIPVDKPSAVGAEYYTRSVDLAVDAMLDAYDGLPRDRMAVLGHSFGGHAALGVAARSDRYRSYIISSAAVDQFGEWGEFVPATRSLPEDGLMMVNQQGWVEVGQGAIGAPPWEDPQAYIDRSPYLTVDRITAPVLLMTADRDYVPMSQMERVFSALFRLGRDARLVTYWGEHHHLTSPANIRDRYAEIFGWLERTMPRSPDVIPSLKGDAPRPEPSPQTPPRQ